MKIKRLEISGFGKFHDRNIEVGDGINVFAGENEAGKTTIYAFLKSMLFDIERGRGRAAAGDMFHRYEPWDKPWQYGGMIQFESGGRTFQIERDFTKNGKKTRFFCLDDGEELSVDDGDLQAVLSDLDRATFENTVAIGQLAAAPGETLQTAVQNYAANYYHSGSSDMDLEASLSYLRERARELSRNVREAEEKRLKKRELGEQEGAYVERELTRLRKEYEVMRERVQDLDRQEETVEKKGRRFLVPALIMILFLSAAGIFLFVPRPLDYLLITAVLIAEILFFWNKVKMEKVVQPEHQDPAMTREKLEWRRERFKEEIREKQTALANIREQIDETYEIGEEEKLLKMRKAALELAAKRLLEVSKDVYQDIGERLNSRASRILKEITEGCYDRIYLEEKANISVYSGNRKIPAERLSRGTLEQIYFAVRMAASEMLCEEEFPVILDDTFSYYDEKRMRAALRWLAENKKQVLLFSCHKREKEALEEMHITYRDGWS